MRPNHDYPKLANQFGIVWSLEDRVKSFWNPVFVGKRAQIHDEIEDIVLASLSIVRYIRLKHWIISADAVEGLLDFHPLLLPLTAIYFMASPTFQDFLDLGSRQRFSCRELVHHILSFSFPTIQTDDGPLDPIPHTYRSGQITLSLGDPGWGFWEPIPTFSSS